jgi:hypothetical protein
MSQSAKSVFYFGVYLVGLGLALMLQPNLLLSIVSIPPTTEVWIRIVGLLALALSAYYIVSGKNEVTVVFKVTVLVRASIILFFTAFVLAGLVKPALILFGVVDLLGAAWTYFALRKEGKW